jgi:hypothetical protein
METILTTPPLAAAAPVVLQQPVSMPRSVPDPRGTIVETVKGLVYYGLLAFGIFFPIAATIYALIAY